MEFNLFIIPITFIIVELLKRYVPKKYLPLLAVLLGAVMGLVYGIYYSLDPFVHIVTGVIYGASACGLYDTATKTLSFKSEDVL